MILSIVHCLGVSLFAMFHPFFISMTEINYNAGSKSLEVSVRIFTDDFEKAIESKCKCTIDLVKPKDRRQNDALISNYITSHLQVFVDGKPVALTWAGYQLEEGSTWSYFEVKDVSAVKNMVINNSLLHDYKTEQINMVHVKANGKDMTDKLDYPDRVFSWGF